MYEPLTVSSRTGIGLAIWNVASSGYVWDTQARAIASVIANQKKWLVPRNLDGETPYKPLTDAPGLFRDFAELAKLTTVDDFDSESVRFADKYGHLGDRARVVSKYGEPTNQGRITLGEAHEIWTRDSYELARLVWLWDLIKESTNDPHLLDSLVGLTPIGAGNWWTVQCELKPPPFVEWTIAETDFISPPRYQNWELDQYVFPAQVRTVDNSNLRRATEILITSLNEKLASLDLTPQVFFEGQSMRPEIRDVPRSLLSTMYYQFALAVTGRSEVVRCKQCKQWFYRRRKNQEFCSGACRARFSREKRQVEEDGQ